MKIQCVKCGDTFTLDKETAELIEEGFASMYDHNVCDDCNPGDWGYNSYDMSYEQFSDADPGL